MEREIDWMMGLEGCDVGKELWVQTIDEEEPWGKTMGRAT